MLRFNYKEPLEKFVLFLILLFPSFSILFQHGSSHTFLFIAIIGMIYGGDQLKKLNKYEKIILLLYCLFFFVAFLSITNADNFDYFYERLKSLFRFIIAIPFYLIIKKLKLKPILALIYGLLIVGFLTPIIAVFFFKPFSLQEVRYVFLEHHIITLGFFTMNISVLCFIITAFFNTTRKIIVLFLVAGVLNLIVCYFTGTRGAYIVLPPVLFISSILYWKWKQNLKFLVPLIVLLFIISVLVSFSNKGLKQRITSIFPKTNDYTIENSILFRIRMSIVALNVFDKHLLIGSGLGDYYDEKKKYLKNNPEYKMIEEFIDAHNSFTDWLVINGVIGTTIMIIAVFLFPLYIFIKYFKRFLHTSSVQFFAAVTGIITIISWIIYNLSSTLLAQHPTIANYLFFVLIFFSTLFSEEEMHDFNIFKYFFSKVKE